MGSSNRSPVVPGTADRSYRGPISRHGLSLGRRIRRRRFRLQWFNHDRLSAQRIGFASQLPGPVSCGHADQTQRAQAGGPGFFFHQPPFTPGDSCRDLYRRRSIYPCTGPRQNHWFRFTVQQVFQTAVRRRAALFLTPVSGKTGSYSVVRRLYPFSVPAMIFSRLCLHSARKDLNSGLVEGSSASSS